MRQHGIDLAGVRSEIVPDHRGAAVAARHVVEQAFELVDIMLDGLPEFRIGAVFAANFVECLLALGGVEAPGEQAAFAAFVTLPQIGGRLVIDHTRDVDRERFANWFAIEYGYRASRGRR